MIDINHAAHVIRESGLFDRDWYSERYPDVELLGLDEVEHFVRYGARMLRSPSPSFDTRFYLASNPDVARGGHNALLHYIHFGRHEGRPTMPRMAIKAPEQRPEARPDRSSFGECVTDMHGAQVTLFPPPSFGSADYDLECKISGPCLSLPYSGETFAPDIAPDIGVHVHLYYPELTAEFIAYLRNIPYRFSLYISVGNAGDVEATVRNFEQALPLATVEVKAFANVGRDIASFVVGFAQSLLKHEFIAHFHTKRSPHNGLKADWRRQLLTHLLGSESVVRSIMRTFKQNLHLGMMFPEYHHSLRGQISWGSNFEICEVVAQRLGIHVAREQLHLFPAGSMFWARSAALRPLLDGALLQSDFPPESGQVDGTVAHAIERLFGEVVTASGHELIQVKADRPHNLTSYYPHKWQYPASRVERAHKAVETYRRSRRQASPGRRVVVFTAVAGGYDRLLPHENLDPTFDYVAFSDTPMNDCGVWDIRPMDFWQDEPVRMARYVKTHPHKYFPEHDLAIWIDANVVIRGDLGPYIERLLAEEAPLAGIPHPQRNCLYQEADAVLRAKKESAPVVERQMEAYKQEGFPARFGLIETNFMIVDLRHPGSRPIMETWWTQIESFSRRDQLSLNYALWKHQSAWVPLMDERVSLRDNPDFAYFGHGRNSGYPLDAQEKGERRDPYAAVAPAEPAARTGAVDIVICVHNALDDVTRCLESVLEAKLDGDRIILVDDASDEDTAAYLDGFAQNHQTILLRNEAPARGYCVTVNVGIRAASADHVLLLNSDTILTRGALEKMVQLMESERSIGIVGPMSNAASTQSVPDIKGTSAQTAVNTLPAGLSVEFMDEQCAAWATPGVQPSVPLVHGFCQLIRREVFEAIGGFDEEAFPQGYGEENDLCFRAVNAGFDLKIATNAYVFHVKSASYTDSERRRTLMQKGAAKLREKHSEVRLARAVRAMEGHPLLVRMREQARDFYSQFEADTTGA